MRKIAVIGAGAVGATLAQRILEKGIADVVLVDIQKSLAIGKAYDLLDAAPIIGHERSILGTGDYSLIESSEIIVVTAGLPRRPGMTREELISKNAGIIKSVSESIKKYAPDAIVIIVTNPLDVMTYYALKMTGFRRERVFGMAGILDGSRMAYLIADELKVPRKSVDTFVLGSHGDTMVPLISKTTVSGRAVSKLIPKDRLDKIIRRTRDRGAEIVDLYGVGSAFYSPSAGVLKMIEAVVNDTGEAIAASVYVEGEYGLRDLCIGLPCEIGNAGIKKIIRFDLPEDELSALKKSAEVIRSSIALL